MNQHSKQHRGVRFVRYFGPVLDALRELGGSGRPQEVKDVIARALNLTESELEETIKSGQGRISNDIDWARFYLAKAGYVDSSTRGVWTLTEAGRAEHLSYGQARELLRSIQRRFQTGRSTTAIPAIEEQETDVPPDESSHRTRLLALLRDLPPKGFEELCQKLLRELGFVKVEVLGRTGDGGIDGEGILQVNRLVSFKVVFQAKRYANTVGAEKVRDFRGAVQGRADKGIIITTGSFSLSAQSESVRAGAIPIELVDSERLIEMFEELRLGLIERTVFDIDEQFFRPFRKTEAAS